MVSCSERDSVGLLRMTSVYLWVVRKEQSILLLCHPFECADVHIITGVKFWYSFWKIILSCVIDNNKSFEFKMNSIRKGGKSIIWIQFKLSIPGFIDKRQAAPVWIGCCAHCSDRHYVWFAFLASAFKNPDSTVWKMYHIPFTVGVSVSSGRAHWTLPWNICAPSVIDLTEMLHRGGVNTK